jgi:hypothetical protein
MASKTTTPGYISGNVTSPVMGPTGAVRCYIHDSVQGGGISLVYKPANAVQALEYAFSLCQTLANVRSLVDLVGTLGEGAATRVKPGTDINAHMEQLATQTTPTVQAPKVDAPAPAPAPVPTTGFDLSALEGMDRERATRWLGVQWTADTVAKLAERAKMPNPGIGEFVRQVKALAAGQPINTPAPAPKAAPAPAAPVVSKPTPAPVATQTVTVGLPTCYDGVEAMSEDAVKALASKLGVAIDGYSLKSAKALVWNAVVDARADALKAGKPAPTQTVTVPAPAPKPIPVAANQAAAVAKVLSNAVSAPTVPTSYAMLVKSGGETLKALATTYGVTLETGGKGVYTRNCTLVWDAIQKAGKPVPTATLNPAVSALQSAPAPVVKPAPAPAVYAKGTILVADGKGGVRVATEDDVFGAMAQWGAK